MPWHDLQPDEMLPLTCTRAGTCCHNKAVWINPWELARLAATLGQLPTAFRLQHLCDQGTRMSFIGAGWRGLPACTLYNPNSGCNAHSGRPLACRLYPLGRKRVGQETASYGFEGPAFPCLADCPEVSSLTQLSLEDYLSGQDSSAGEAALDSYVELTQDLAELAFSVWIDSGLQGRPLGKSLINRWQQLAKAGSPAWALYATPLLEHLQVPALDAKSDSSTEFIEAHAALLQTQLGLLCASAKNDQELIDVCVCIFATALLCGQSCGLAGSELAAKWISNAQTHLN